MQQLHHIHVEMGVILLYFPQIPSLTDRVSDGMGAVLADAKSI